MPGSHHQNVFKFKNVWIRSNGGQQFSKRSEIQSELSSLIGIFSQIFLSFDYDGSPYLFLTAFRLNLNCANWLIGTNLEELKNIYILFVRSLLEQSAIVWHSSLSEENKSDLERVQKTTFKIILLGEKYKTYKHALNILE